MIGWLAKKVFEIQADSLTNKFCNDPKLKKSWQTYIDETKEFKKELKRAGLTSTEDLKKAIEKSPNLTIKFKNY